MAHNKFRQIHGTIAMQLNNNMCNEAEAYAKTLAQRGGPENFSARDRNNDGENVAYSCSSVPGASYSGAKATKNWYGICMLLNVYSIVCQQ